MTTKHLLFAYSLQFTNLPGKTQPGKQHRQNIFYYRGCFNYYWWYPSPFYINV